MKVSEAIKELTTILNNVGDLDLYIGGVVADEDGEEYNTKNEIDYISTIFKKYAYLEMGDECD